MNLNGEEYYYIRNAQGDIIGLIDQSGTEVVSYGYDTWGKLISISGTLASTVGEKNPYRYRGYRYDTETGLYYLQSRYYNPEWGRFINADSYGGKIGNILSHNAFAYSGNNPVTYADPSGQWFETALDVAAVAISTVAFIRNPSWSTLGFLAWDLGAAALPFVPGSYVGKGLKAASKIEEVGGATKTVAKTATKGTGNATGSLKRGPKPFGTGSHNLTIKEVADSVTDGKIIAGGQRLPEVGIKTPGGIKSSRRPDILVERPDGSIYGINVGKTTSLGAPIKREVEAIYDLEDAGIEMFFVPYGR